MSPHWDAARLETVLRGLKDFQLESVDYVFQRMYLDQNPTNRFLIADEVGLGKTLVARGLIAKVINHLWNDVERIDVIYICSNADIARQNITRLNVTGQEDFALASRITLLPITLKDLKGRRLNFISFTPGTSFDLKSTLGTSKERALLYWLLKQAWDLTGTGPLNVLQGNAGTESFREQVRDFETQHEIDESIATQFATDLDRRIQYEQSLGQVDFRVRFDELCRRFRCARQHLPVEDAKLRLDFVGELRAMLAVTCLEALEPDLIILDEFQRFRYLLDGTDRASQLAKGLFEYAAARVVLLSATPYKMYTLSHESEQDDHYTDFVRTVRFLQNNPAESMTLDELIQQYRQELFRTDPDHDARLRSIKTGLEDQLRRVMVRTERLAVTQDRSGMLKEIASAALPLTVEDLKAYIGLQRVARLLKHQDTLEYWKSAPYLLNFMDGYDLKDAFLDALETPSDHVKLASVMSNAASTLLPWSSIQSYGEIDPRNARLRRLMADTLDTGMWRLLWLPPSLPYHSLAGAFAAPGIGEMTKRLIFSAWHVVPKVVSTLLSYEAERRMFRLQDPNPENSPEARRRRRPLLRFAREENRLTGLPLFALIFPCRVLAEHCDPRVLYATRLEKPELPALDAVRRTIRERISELIRPLLADSVPGDRSDESWYWAAPILLDLHHHDEPSRAWLGAADLAGRWAAREDDEEDEEGHTSSRWAEHVAHVRGVATGHLTLGPPPDDLLEVLVDVALAAPAVTALRSLARLGGGFENPEFPEVQLQAARIGRAFLRLFNLPESMALIRGMQPAEPYWRRVLEYCCDGCLQAVLDEYVHVLRDSEGLFDELGATAATRIADRIIDAITLRTASPGVDEIRLGPSGDSIAVESQRLRERFAVRFSREQSDEAASAERFEQVRTAFNSPFWPFVLASTSIGQEGLDFHQYCHAVVHWNLPSNPVDLEQREGRVHRYKGHAVRKNIAATYSKHLGPSADDPWETMFDAARRDRTDGTSDLVPYWLFPLEGGAAIERHIMALPLSRDSERAAALRRSLAVYRMVFGQSRQEELVEYLSTRLSTAETRKAIEQSCIDLSPPRRRCKSAK